MTRKVWWKALFVFVIVISSQIHFTQNSYAKKPDFFFNFDIELRNTENTQKIADLIIEDLKQIGINATSFVRYYFIPPPKIPGDLDSILDETGGRNLLHPYYYFDENGHWNYFYSWREFPYDVPYMVEGMEMLNELKNQTNFDTQIASYKEWQEFTLDNILLVLPLIDPKRFIFTWSNLKGLNQQWGISDSLPYMYFEGLHENQRAIDELNLHESFSYYGSLNPVSKYIFEDQVYTFFMEPLLKLTPDKIPTKRGLIEDWEFIDENHLKFYMRDNLFWSPSYNITNYDGTGTPPLMGGLKYNETSNGYNKKVTAYDAVFTLLFHANAENDDYNEFLSYVSELYVDPSNNLTFHLKTDFNNIPANRESVKILWEDLQVFCLPEFFLNSTNTTLTYSSGGVGTWGLYEDIWETQEWKTYGVSPFGCGKYNIHYYNPYEKIILNKNPNWHGIGALDGMSKEITINKIRFLDTSETEGFETGELDIITAHSYYYYAKKELEKFLSDSNFVSYSTFSGNQYGIVFNLYNDIIGNISNFEYLTDPGKENYTKALAVRKAIAYAINRERINEEVFNSTYSLSQSLVSQKYSSWVSDNSLYDYNLTEAWEWMEVAGYRQDSLRANMYKTIFSPLVILILVVTLKRTKRSYQIINGN